MDKKIAEAVGLLRHQIISPVLMDSGQSQMKYFRSRFGAERPELKVVADQIGSPIYAKDLASLVVEHGLKNWNFKGGLYHYSNEGVAS